MKRGIVCLLFGVLGSLSFGLPMTHAVYELSDLEYGRWQYVYDVSNLRLERDTQPAAIEEFTIWFEAALYRNLVITTAEPALAEWDQIVWQPEVLLHDDGGFDALAAGLTVLYPGQTASGFAVSFDWLGEGLPGSQYYEIVDPATFEVMDAGFTIPEPAAILLVCLGGLCCLRKTEA